MPEALELNKLSESLPFSISSHLFVLSFWADAITSSWLMVKQLVGESATTHYYTYKPE